MAFELLNAMSGDEAAGEESEPLRLVSTLDEARRDRGSGEFR